MGMVQAVRSVFSNYFDFKGRASRPEFWWFVLFTFLIGILLAILNSIIFGPQTVVETVTIFPNDGSPAQTTTREKQVYNGGWLHFIFQIAVFVPSIAVAWRRMHDSGKPGWWLLIPITLFVGTIFGFMIYTDGWDNFWGAAASANEVKVRPQMDAFWIIFLFCVGCVITTIFWLCRRSEQSGNKWGPQISGTEV